MWVTYVYLDLRDLNQLIWSQVNYALQEDIAPQEQYRLSIALLDHLTHILEEKVRLIASHVGQVTSVLVSKFL
jgi:hypothetical protein